MKTFTFNKKAKIIEDWEWVRNSYEAVMACGIKNIFFSNFKGFVKKVCSYKTNLKGNEDKL
jgi:hypothetical protein